MEILTILIWMGAFFIAGIAHHHLKYQSFLRIKIFPFAQPGTIFSRKLFRDLNGFNEQFKFSADFDFFIRAYQQKSIFIKHIGYTVAAFRLHSDQLTQEHKLTMEKEVQRSFDKISKRTSWFNRKCAKTAIRIQNLPNYIVRILRYYKLCNVVSIPKSMSIINNEDAKRNSRQQFTGD